MTRLSGSCAIVSSVRKAVAATASGKRLGLPRWLSAGFELSPKSAGDHFLDADSLPLCHGAHDRGRVILAFPSSACFQLLSRRNLRHSRLTLKFCHRVLLFLLPRASLSVLQPAGPRRGSCHCSSSWQAVPAGQVAHPSAEISPDVSSVQSRSRDSSIDGDADSSCERARAMASLVSSPIARPEALSRLPGFRSALDRRATGSGG